MLHDNDDEWKKVPGAPTPDKCVICASSNLFFEALANRFKPLTNQPLSNEREREGGVGFVCVEKGVRSYFFFKNYHPYIPDEKLYFI